MATKPVAGVLPVVHTPFDDADCIDFGVLKHQIDWAFDQGADGVCTGMVSELLRLTHDERLALTEALVRFTANRGAVVASVGAESTKQAVEFAKHAAGAGCDALMAIPPISTALDNEEVLRYFSALADAVDAPIIVQDASAYVGKAIEMCVHVELLERYGADKIMFKPEASPIGPNLSQLRDRTTGQAKIFEGSGGITLVDSFRRGVAGTIPGMDLLDAVVALWRALQRGDDAETYRLYFPICAIVALQMQAGLDGFLAIEKYILVKRGVFQNENRRTPNGWTLDDETAREIDRLLTFIQP